MANLPMSSLILNAWLAQPKFSTLCLHVFLACLRPAKSHAVQHEEVILTHGSNTKQSCAVDTVEVIQDQEQSMQLQLDLSTCSSCMHDISAHLECMACAHRSQQALLGCVVGKK
jgi:hypothetical protein